MNTCEMCESSGQCRTCGSDLDAGTANAGSITQMLVFGVVFLAVLGGMSGLDQLIELPDAVAKWAKAGLMTALILVAIAVQSAISGRRRKRSASGV